LYTRLRFEKIIKTYIENQLKTVGQLKTVDDSLQLEGGQGLPALLRLFRGELDPPQIQVKEKPPQLARVNSL
jgi:hypothetical protein